MLSGNGRMQAATPPAESRPNGQSSNGNFESGSSLWRSVYGRFFCTGSAWGMIMPTSIPCPPVV